MDFTAFQYKRIMLLMNITINIIIMIIKVMLSSLVTFITQLSSRINVNNESKNIVIIIIKGVRKSVT